MRAPNPANEAERLKVLREYELLDTEREQDYDDLVDLASNIASCPMAVISLVDADRQWFKACLGMKERETSREISFCAHAILTPDQPFIVPDTSKDSRFAENANVTGGPGIRFYAGIPLVTDAGVPLGTLCVMDRESRELTPLQMKLLSALTRQVTQLMELRRMTHTLARALEEVKTLEGLLPICCHCKAIKNEQGEWTRLEAYVMRRTGANFTHGFCPDCAKKLYPEWDLTSPDGPTRK